MRWQPSAPLANLRLRARLLAQVRAFFGARGLLEVDTPRARARATVTDPHLASLSTRIAGLPGEYFLQTSPEYAMKRLLAAGSGDVWQLCRVFRDGECGRLHNPEFTLLEWYRVGWDAAALVGEVEALFRELLGVRLHGPAERIGYAAAFARELGVDPHRAEPDELASLARARLGDVPDLGADRDAWLDLLMGFVVAPALGHGRLCFVGEWPASQAALARLLPGSPPRAARFEAYLDGIELCNGFHELADAGEQRRRFEADLALRAARGLPRPPLDERLLAALEAGLPDCAGVAVGFDRVVMLAAGAESLREVLAFSAADA